MTNEERLKFINKIEEDLNNNIINESDIREINEKELILCLENRKYDFIKKIIKPFKYLENGEEYYKYFVDPFSTGIFEFLKRLPETDNDAYKIYLDGIRYANIFGSFDSDYVEEKPMSKEEYILKEKPLIISNQDKTDLINSFFEIDMEKIEREQIKNSLARQISGYANPVESEKDMIYYAEHANLLAMIMLYRKGITTVYNDTENCYNDPIKENAHCYIGIRTTDLSNENIEVLNSLAKNGYIYFSSEHEDSCYLQIPCDRNETVGNVNNRWMEVVNQFYNQKVNDESMQLNGRR